MQAIKRCDVILDLSESNRPFYDSLVDEGCKLPKLFLGPHIFPSRCARFDGSESEKLVFFGACGDGRRSKVLSGLSGLCQVLPPGVHYTELYESIKTFRGVANVHFDEGVYTEAPRLLTAVSCGKTFFSEGLAPPFQVGVHYLDLADRPSVDDECRVYSAMAELVETKFAFENFLSLALEVRS